MRYLSVDLETTGLNKEKCQVLEIAVVYDDTEHVQDITACPYFHCYIQHPMYCWEPTAYKMNQKLFEEILNAKTKIMDTLDLHQINFYKQWFGVLDSESVGYAVSRWLKAINYEAPYIVAGKNYGSFDLGFLERLPHFTEKVKLPHRHLDPGSWFVTLEDIRIPDLKECKKRAKLPENIAHRALDDARDVILLTRHHYNIK
jgi:DNA polymerase III epsilon subunit-like protein